MNDDGNVSKVCCFENAFDNSWNNDGGEKQLLHIT